VAGQWKDEMENVESPGSRGIRDGNCHSGICWMAILPEHGPIRLGRPMAGAPYEVLNSLNNAVGWLTDAETGQRAISSLFERALLRSEESAAAYQMEVSTNRLMSVER